MLPPALFTRIKSRLVEYARQGKTALLNRYETVILAREAPFDRDCTRRWRKTDHAEVYRRFAPSDDGISPRAIPGDADGMHVITGLEHNELSRPNDQPEMHTMMSRKRHDKLDAALNHPDFTVCKRFGDDGPVDVGLLAWGSTFGETLEAMFKARAEGIRCAAMKVVMLSPFPTTAVSGFMDDCRRVLVPELNYEGQFAKLVQAELARPAPIPAPEILAAG